MQLQQGMHGGALHISATPGFGEREMPAAALFTPLSMRSFLVNSTSARLVPPR
jgi:hypothetical protein